jgi:hypothetical protein
MKLITKAIEAAFAKQGDTSQMEMSEIKIVMKLFNPWGAGTWYIYEHLEDDIYMAFVNLNDPMCAECGTISMTEIEEWKHPVFRLGIERDMHFEPLSITLKSVYETIKAGGHV